MKPLILAILIVLPFVTLHAQTHKPEPVREPCKLTIDQVPEVRGLRLGQSYDHLNKILPERTLLEGVRGLDAPDEYGIRRLTIYPWTLSRPELLSGIHTISLTYFDDSLKIIKVSYNGGVEWQSNLHFVAAIAEQLGLPREGWLERNPSYLTCQGFVVSVRDARLMPTLQLVDRRFSDEIEKRRADVEAKKRARFRP